MTMEIFLFLFSCFSVGFFVGVVLGSLIGLRAEYRARDDEPSGPPFDWTTDPDFADRPRTSRAELEARIEDRG
jgi:hypothetical protein